MSTYILRFSPLFAIICLAAGVVAFLTGGFVIGAAMIVISISFVLVGRGKIPWDELPMWRKNGVVGLQLLAIVLLAVSLFYTGGK